MSDGWRDIATAPKDGTVVLLTDGKSVREDEWVVWALADVHAPSWRHFQHLAPTHWRPLPAPPQGEQGQDFGIDGLIDRFGAAVKDKLREATAKYGWTSHWQRPDWQHECVTELLRHVGKGDPRDVAAYCAFAWHHGWSTQRDTPQHTEQPEELAGLRCARDRIAAPGGWNPNEPPQGMLVNTLFKLHPSGTISLAWNSVYTALNEAGHQKGTISVWERMVGRTQAEVVALLDRAVEIAEQTGDTEGPEMSEEEILRFSRHGNTPR